MRRTAAAGAVLLVAATGTSCWREHREFRGSPAAASRSAPLRISALQPGPKLPDPAGLGPYEAFSERAVFSFRCQLSFLLTLYAE